MNKSKYLSYRRILALVKDFLVIISLVLMIAVKFGLL
jgi:hypothetical protein